MYTAEIVDTNLVDTAMFFYDDFTKIYGLISKHLGIAVAFIDDLTRFLEHLQINKTLTTLKLPLKI